MVSDPSIKTNDEVKTLDDESFRQILRSAALVLALALGLPLLGLLCLVLFLLQSAKWVDQTDQTISVATSVEKMLVTMQTDFRGFRLADDEKFLDRYYETRVTADKEWIKLSAFVSDNPTQRVLVDQARASTAKWLASVDSEIEKVRSGQSPAADPSFLKQSLPLFEETVALIETFIKKEEQSRATRGELLNLITTVLLATLALTALLGVPALIVWTIRQLKAVGDAYKISAESARRRASELYVTLNSIGDAVVVTDASGLVTFLNPVAENLMGWANSEAKGLPLHKVFDIHNESTGAVTENPVERVLKEKIVVGLANHTILRSRDGRECAIEDSTAPICDENGEVSGVILVFHDVSESRVSAKQLQESELRFRFLNELGDATRSLVDPGQIMEVSARMLGELLKTSRCAYADVEADGESFNIRHDYTNGVPSVIGAYHLSLFGPRASDDMRNGRTLVIYDMDTEVKPTEGGDTFAAIGVKAIVCCPLVKDGRLHAMMAVHQNVQRRWSSHEVELVEEVVDRCWATIERAVAETRLRERGRLSELRAEISGQLILTTRMEQTLQRCCELIVNNLSIDLARIWILDPKGKMLELQASAGRLTQLNGLNAKMPFPSSDLGSILQEARVHVMDNLTGNAGLAALAEAKELTNFAGYPLLVEGAPLGVLVICTQKSLSKSTLDDLALLADSLSKHLDRKRKEEALREAMEVTKAAGLAVAESAERFRLLAEVVSLQVWTADLEGKLDYANHECVEYFDADLETQILGNAWAQFVHPDDIAAALKNWTASLASGERYEVEFRLKNHKGEFRWFLVRAEAMRDKEGRIQKWFGTNTDIHDLKLAQYAAESANRAKDSFLAALSHELRTPLTPVLMAATTLRNDERLPLDVREELGMMERNISLEGRLIDDLLDLTSIARGKTQLRSQTCDAHSLIGLAIEIVREEAVAKGIEIVRDFSARPCGLTADPSRFQQVIWNLLRNAVKFTPNGGRVSIRTLNEPNDMLGIQITDSGVGIPEEALEKIFHPFEQAGHQFGGLGLGLAIARAIVVLHGGNLTARSPGPNLGSTFIVELPGVTESPQSVHAKAPATHPPPPTETLGEATKTSATRLLLVEDHEDSRELLSKMLSLSGYTVAAARSVSVALELASKQKFDLVISDLGLPDGTGHELMEKLRETYGLRGIALSGYGMEEDVARSKKSGFVTHLIKPFDFTQLALALKQLE